MSVVVSFIIPAHNEEALLPRTLDCLIDSANGTLTDYEIIVVDDASTDRTAEIAAVRGARVVSANKRQIAAVRNAGARAARGDVLIFLDADTLLPERTLRSALRELDNGAVGGGARVKLDGPAPMLNTLMAWAIVVTFRYAHWAAGCFVYARRADFEAAGGFDEAYFAGEEWYLSRAMKKRGRFVVVPDPVITSARKLHRFGAMQILWRATKILLRGQQAIRQREGLDLWYENRPSQP